LGQPEGEDELGSGHEQLGCQALEEGSESLVLHHVGNDSEAALGVLEISVLDTGLDDIERGRDQERGGGTGDRGDEVLRPGCRVVVAEFVEVLLGYSGATK
jgi:hypothetical protein